MIRESEILELKHWLEHVHRDFNNETIEPHLYEALGSMLNILYGRKARPNKYRRRKK